MTRPSPPPSSTPGPTPCPRPDGPDGYTAGTWSCANDGGAPVVGDSVELLDGVSTVCTINNDDQPATLTLVKTVTNDNGGTALPTDWTLAAGGPTPISGATGTGPVTDAPVSAGTYTLSESGGPAGYTAGTWSCMAGESPPVVGDSLVLVNGEDVTCTINNDDQPTAWTLSKTSDPASGSQVMPGDTISFTVTAHRISGVIDPTGLSVTDNLSNVLTHATIDQASITASTGTPTLSGNEITWTIPTLASDATLTYKVKVNADAFGATIGNVITGTGTTPTPPPVDCAGPDAGRQSGRVQDHPHRRSATDDDHDDDHDHHAERDDRGHHGDRDHDDDDLSAGPHR